MLTFDVALVPIITGIVQLAKEFGFPGKWSPLLAVFLGIAAGVYLSPNDIVNGVVNGIVLGLSSVGLYSGPKNILEKLKDVRNNGNQNHD